MTAPQRPESVDITEHLGLVHHIMHRRGFARRAGVNVDADDLAQVGMMALMRAAESFDPARGVTFATYAAFWVRHHMGRLLENESSTVRTPVHVQRKRYTRGEYMRCQVRSLNVPASDHRAVGHGDDRREDIDLLAYPEPESDCDDLPSDSLEELIADTPSLSERHATVLRLRAQGKTLVEIGAELGVSRERIRQIESEAIELIRRAQGVRRAGRAA